MKSFLSTLRLLGYHYGLHVKPEHLIPTKRLYKSGPLHLPPLLKKDDNLHKDQTTNEIQAHVKLQTIKALVYSDLEEWASVVGFLAETISQIEGSHYVVDFVLVLFNLYGNALLKSGTQQEGDDYLEKRRKIVRKVLFAERCKKENLDGYNLIIDPEEQEAENKNQKVVEKVSN